MAAVVAVATEMPKSIRWEPLGGGARGRAQYDAYLPVLSLQDWGNSRTLLEGGVLPTLHSYIICKKWHLCRACWEYCEHKKSHVPTTPQGWQPPSPG